MGEFQADNSEKDMLRRRYLDIMSLIQPDDRMTLRTMSIYCSECRTRVPSFRHHVPPVALLSNGTFAQDNGDGSCRILDLELALVEIPRLDIELCLKEALGDVVYHRLNNESLHVRVVLDAG